MILRAIFALLCCAPRCVRVAWCGKPWHGALAALGAVALASNAAGTVADTTDPQSCLVYRVPAQSDLRFGLPLHRPPAFEGRVATVSGTTITLERGANWTNWSTNVWTLNEGHYALIANGSAEGTTLRVTANGADTLTLATAPTGVVTGTLLRLVPYWTLASIFPDGPSLLGTTSITGVGASQILQVDRRPGINLASTAGFYYFTGSTFGGAGWRQDGANPNTKKDSAPVDPDAVFIFRNVSGAAIEWTLRGAVQLAASRISAGTLQANLAQDNLLSLRVAVPVSLANSGLVASLAARPTTSITGVGADLVLVFDPLATGYNRASTASYYYYNGADFGGPGWRKDGASPTTLQNTALVFQPGQPVVLRRAATAVPSEISWTVLPSYLQ